MLNSNKLRAPRCQPTDPGSLQSARRVVQDQAVQWWSRTGWLLHVPDVGPACEVLLADRLFHDLDDDERAGLVAFVRGSQDESGAWLDVHGEPDLSLTALGWWALRDAGDDPTAEPMVLAQRVVHRLGGAQRANFAVRLWLAMGGQIPWAWLPALPSELLLLPPSVVLSPSRFSPWARGVLIPYLIIARAPAHLQLCDASPLLLPHSDGEPLSPRLTRPGLAGDVLQAFDRAVKLARKLPRGPLPNLAGKRAQQWIDEHQQAHGGWFSLRPTILSLIALRVLGVASDDPRIRAGLDHLRAARGRATIAHGRRAGEVALAQGGSRPCLDVSARLLRGLPPDSPEHNEALVWLLDQQLRGGGPWQARADAAAGGWPHEPGASRHVDVDATCAVLEALAELPADHRSAGVAWAASRRGIDVLFAMQEPDGRFSRFERGESEVLMRRLPWVDADLLAHGHPDDAEHLRVSARALACLHRAGFGRDDDRIARGVAWLAKTLEPRLHEEISTAAMHTVATLAAAIGGLWPANAPIRQQLELRLRARQREDGSFGSTEQTAYAVQALIALGIVDVQTERAATWLAQRAANDPQAPAPRPRPVERGVGLHPAGFDPSAATRETAIALRQYERALEKL